MINGIKNKCPEGGMIQLTNMCGMSNIPEKVRLREQFEHVKIIVGGQLERLWG